MTTLSLVTRNYLSLPNYTRGYIDFLGVDVDIGPAKPLLQVYVVEPAIVKIYTDNVDVRNDD